MKRKPSSAPLSAGSAWFSVPPADPARGRPFQPADFRFPVDFRPVPLDLLLPVGTVRPTNSDLAQLVEQAAVNRRVLGSSPRVGATKSLEANASGLRCF